MQVVTPYTGIWLKLDNLVLIPQGIIFKKRSPHRGQKSQNPLGPAKCGREDHREYILLTEFADCRL